MKIKTILTATLVAGLFAGCAAPHHASQAELAAQARISRADAEKIALAQAPTGTVKEAELEKEHGKLVWSFDIAVPGTPDITEVLVDANTGAVVAVEKETLEQQKKEKDEDAGKEKKDKNDKD
jgi:hypothetical protein